eukprot:7093-Heterococcus_DN1.PRE.1
MARHSECALYASASAAAAVCKRAVHSNAAKLSPAPWHYGHHPLWMSSYAPVQQGTSGGCVHRQQKLIA